MRFLSLFTGIGGMDLGLERAGWECVGQCEIDPYCRRVLDKHWPHVKKHDDVRTLNPLDFPAFDAIVGGFPCQDVSNAGLRAGISAPRSGLYGELVRCLRVARPQIGLLENVAALLARGMGRVLADLAEIGYDAEWDCIPACAVGAIHERYRVFIVANRDGIGRTGLVKAVRSCQMRQGWEGRAEDLQSVIDCPYEASSCRPQPLICGMDDGISDRVDRIRGVGNAVVPQVAELIGRSILETKQMEKLK